MSLKQLLLQVNTPFYSVEYDNGNRFISPGDDFFTRHLTPAQFEKITAYVPGISPATCGDHLFKKRHGLKYPYIAGAMANGITSAAMVKSMAENGMMGFFGAGGLTINEIEKNIVDITNSIHDKPFGFNLIHSPYHPTLEMETVQLYLKYGITRISAAAFMRMTPALVYFRVKGLYKDGDGRVTAPNNIIAKISRVEIARQFFSPPPEKIIRQLLEKGMITPQEAEYSQSIPMAWDLTAEADSGGHTDNRPALALLPTMLALKNEYMETYQYHEPLCVGLGGGISTPQSAAAAFSMGAAYLLTGSINQSCVESGVCNEVKEMLCQAQQADVAMAPAADMFEIGARVQVLKRGTLFPMRAEKLYQLYKTHSSFDEIDEKLKQEIQDKFLQASFEDAWMSTRSFFEKSGNVKEIEHARNNPKHKMALVFRSYLGLSSKWAIQGEAVRKMDYQIWCGPAIGAFNQWVKGSFLEKAANRKTAEIGLNLLFGACVAMRASILKLQGVPLSFDADDIRPMPLDEIQQLIA